MAATYDFDNHECQCCGNIGQWMVQEKSDKAALIECVVCDCPDVVYPRKEAPMTEYCLSCLGCQAMEDPNFNGVHRCPGWRDGREPENEQIKFDEVKE